MDNPLLDKLEVYGKKSIIRLFDKLPKASWKTKLIAAGSLTCFIVLPFYVSLPLVGFVIYRFYFRQKSSHYIEEDLDILGNARWARIDDLIIGLGTKQKPEPCLLTISPENKSQILLGKFMTPTRSENKKNNSYEENYIISTNEGHILTIAQTGAGKGTNVVIPNLLKYGHSVVVLDPKGENFIKTHWNRENSKEQEICLIDPFGEVSREVGAIITRIENSSNSHNIEALEFFKNLQSKTSTYGNGQYLKGFNPLQVIEDLLEQKEFDLIIDEANVISDMIVVTSPNDKDPHWNEKAKSFIRGFIMVLAFGDKFQQDRKTYPISLIKVKELIEDTFSTNERMNLFLNMCKTKDELKSVASTISMIADNERGSVLSTVLRHLDFLNSKNVQDSLNRNDFQLDDIRINPKTIYLVLPANKITSYNRLARLWISSIKSSLERINDGYRESRPVLFMLDEVAQLGRMEPLVNAISLSRSYGIKLWLIFQDVAQMKVAYPNEEWRTFFSNTKAQQFFGISSTDTDTCKFVSEIAGQTTITFNTESYSEGTNSGGSSNYGYSSGGESSSSSSGGGTSSGQSKTYSINQQVQARPLVNPNEVAQITIDHILIFGVTKFPIMAKKMPYYNSKLYIKRYPFLLDPATYKI
jgi:type IV secretion system protein VirD4